MYSSLIHILYIIIFPSNVENLMDASLYDIFTTEIIDNRGHILWTRLSTVIKNLLKAILVEPLMEYILLIVLMVIPWPFLKKVSYSHRLHIIFMKVGIFNIIISLVCMNYKDMKVDTILEVPE